ncbi:MAG: DUF2892 domain-containing protein [Methylomonas sp.]|jgi:hypothetical protein|uniref:YgaP family membrane protein n=1 Tax=Methylomonas sp. TaxID=418 RepID=UPI0025E7608E|nr:DUF2892 domain-containing protein [Methylomonas sp.]MCK9607413.1 DUF2892 domain-containing protein [Methylomonas sp.]
MNFDYKRMIKFEHNVGAKDKKIRLISGVVLLAVSLFTASVILLLVGLVLVATSYFGWCPAYSGFGKNSLEAGAVVADTAASSETENDA